MLQVQAALKPSIAGCHPLRELLFVSQRVGWWTAKLPVAAALGQ